MAERVYLTVAEVVAIHYQQIEMYGGLHGLRDNGALEAAVFRPLTGYYSSIAEEAAALESIANGHAFLDGNKRVAFAAAHTFLLVNGHTIEADPNEVYNFMLGSITKGNFRFAEILDWLRKHIKPLRPSSS